MLTLQQQLEAFAEKQPTMLAISMAAGALLGINLLVRFLTQKRASNSHALLVTPGTLPVVGNTLGIMLFHGDRLYDWFLDQCVALNGKPWIMQIVSNPPGLMISTPELFEDVLKTQFESFKRGDIDIFTDLFSKGILATDGEVWAFHRKTASNLFSNQMIKDVMYAAVREKCERLCKSLRVYESRGEAVSFKAVIMHFTSDIFGKISFGVDLDCLEHGVEGKKGNEFVEAFATLTRMMYFRFMQPMWLWKLKRYLNVSTERTNRESREVIDKFIYRVIDESIAKEKEMEAETESSSSSKDNAPPAPKDFISLFINSTTKDDENLKGTAFDSKMHLIRDTVVNFIFAGKDTTSHTMSFFIVMMNRHPQVLAKIREELREKLPRSFTGEILIPTMDDLPQLIYLEAAIRENLRLNPVAPLVPRQATEGVVLCDGAPLSKGSRVALVVYASGRMKSICDDALEFKPERWIDSETGKLLVVSPFKFMVFIGGRRNCIGMKFAMMEIKCTLAVLLSRLDFKTVENPWEMTYEAALTMTVKGPLHVKVALLIRGEVARSARRTCVASNGLVL